MNVYEIVTEKFVQAMERDNIAPWQKTWSSSNWPKNLVSKKEYSGVNVWLLSMNNFSSPYWATYKQIKNYGGVIKKDQYKEYTIIVYYQPQIINEQGEEVQIAVLRYYRVWNTDQCDGLEGYIPVVETISFNKIGECEKIIDGYKDIPTIKNHHRAIYSPLLDEIGCPPYHDFKSMEDYYGTLFHEIIHSTGHKKRLDRFTKKTVEGDYIKAYSFEELVAEMGASFLCSIAGIDLPVIENQIAYVKGWLKKLQDDKRLVVKASAAAKKAVEYMGVHNDTERKKGNGE